MHKITKLTILSCLVLAIFIFYPNSTKAGVILEPGFEEEIVASGLTLPTNMAFAPDGRIFIALKGGEVRVVKNGALLPSPVITLTDINTFGDRGLIGIAVDPNFSSNGFLYLAYTFENTPGLNFGGAKTGRIVRVTVVGDVASESSKLVLVGTVGGNASSPSCENFLTTDDCIPSDSSSHSVGGLRFGPDGYLYATTGDGADFNSVDPRALRAQNLDSLGGKILRLKPDGTAPTDNPFYDGNPNSNRSKVFAYGVRNMYRFGFKPGTSSLLGGDVGWSSWEEINEILPGTNYGWPCREGNSPTAYGCTAVGAIGPKYTYPHDGNGAGSIAAGTFPNFGAYPSEYDNSYFIGDYAQSWVKRVVLDANNDLVSVHDFIVGGVYPVDLSSGPDGHVYYLDIAFGTLNRITHTTGNRKPVVVASATPTSGLQPLTVNFSSAGTVDPDGDALAFAWNFGDGAVSTLANPTHIFTANGKYIVILTVTDIHGSSSIVSIEITVGNQAPKARITAPANGFLYQPGQTIQLQGLATDPEDGDLPLTAYNWQIILHHNVHIHYLQNFSNTANPVFIADDHADPDVYMEVTLTVTDSGGLTHTDSINLYYDNGQIGGNLIINPSMEVEDSLPGQPLGWSRGGYGLNNAIYTYPVAGLDGNSASKVEVTNYVDGDAKWIFSPVSVSGGKQYLVSNYYTADTDTDHVVQYGFSDGTYQYVYLGNYPATTTPVKIEHTVTVPAGAQTFSLFHTLSQIGTLTTDNFSMVQLDPTDVIPPTATITSPTSGQTLSGTTTVNASATDNVGVAGVALFINGTQVGTEDSTSPYSFSLDTTSFANGAYSLEVKARDFAGNPGTSEIVNATVNNPVNPNLIQNPSLETEGTGGNPQNWSKGGWGTNTRVFTYPVSGSNSAKGAKVEISSYTSGDAKWYFADIPITGGQEYTISNRYSSNIPSQTVLRYALAGGTTQYVFLANLPSTSNAWQTFQQTFTTPVGAVSLTMFHLIAQVGILTVDEFGLILGTASTDSTPPTANIYSPTEGQTLTGPVTVNINATDNVGVVGVALLVDGTTVGPEDTTAPFSFNLDTTLLTDGGHTLTVRARDLAGNVGTSVAINVNIDNTTTANLILNGDLEAQNGTAPSGWSPISWGSHTASFSYPVVGRTGGKAMEIQITAYPFGADGDSRWQHDDVAVTPGIEYTYEEYSKATTISDVIGRYTLTDGSYHYFGLLKEIPPSSSWQFHTAKFIPPVGAVSVSLLHVISTEATLTLDDIKLFQSGSGTPSETEPPVVTFTSPLDGATISGTVNLTASATDNVGVTQLFFAVNGTPIGPMFGSAPYTLAFDTTTLTNGPYTLKVTATDAVGNNSFATINVTVNNTNPSGNNLIQNPSLETEGTGGNPQNWSKGGWGTNTRVFTYPVSGSNSAKGAKVEISSYTSGDAKWYFADIPVEPSTLYTLAHQYRSNVPTNLTLRYTLSTGGVQYVGLGNLPVSTSWALDTQNITTPTNAVSVTLFHSLVSTGWLEVDDYSLSLPGGGGVNPDAFANGMISLSFDDGWLSHYTNALPVLEAENVTGTFYIITDEISAVGSAQNLIQNPSLETEGTGGNPQNWSKGGWGTNTRVFTYPVSGSNSAKGAKVEISSYTSGDAKWYFADIPITGGQEYTISNRYSSNIPSQTVLRYALAGGTTQYVFLANLPSTSNAWQTFQQTFTTPVGAVSLTMFHLIAQVGILTVDEFGLTTSTPSIQSAYMSSSQLLSLQSTGHEIGAHTKSHPYLTTLTTSQQQDEIAGSRAILQGLGLTPVATIAYPYGDHNAEVKTVTEQSGFIGARSTNSGFNTKSTEKYALKIQVIDRTTTLSDVQNWINQARLNKTWLILMFHQIDDNPAATLGATPAFLQEIITAAKNSALEIITVNQGVQLLNP